MTPFTQFAAVFVLLSLPAAALAQSRRGPVAVADVEYARITEDDGYLGAGVGAGGGVQFHLTGATSVGVEIARTHHVRDLGFRAVAYDASGRIDAFPYTVRWQGTATWLLGRVSHAFGSAAVRPLVWGGGGMMWHGGTSIGPLTTPQVPTGFVLQPGSLETHRGASSTAFALDGGLGVEIRASHRLTLSPFAGLRLANTGNFGPKYILRTGVRVGFKL
jgi:hypothetical protein